MLRLLLFCLILLSPVLSKASDNITLSIDEVLSSSSEHFPAIIKSLENRQQALGRLTESQGAFDVVFSSDGYSRATGFWDGRIINTDVRRNLRNYGATVYGGYRISEGSFPIYEDINFTNTGGEVKVGALFSLLRDKAIDQRRFNVGDAKFAVEQSELEILLTQIGVQTRASIAYWQWVAYGHQLKVYENLLSIAEDRAKGLEEQVRTGARAPIFIVENQQNITRRQRLVIEANRDFLSASNQLAFYYRGATGEMITPDIRQLPGEEILFTSNHNQTSSVGSKKYSDALSNRPELKLLRTSIERTENEITLRKNNLKPKLDLSAELSHDFGAIAEGGESRDSTDTIIGFQFSVPLEQREARGKLSTARAKLRALELDQLQTQQQLELEIRNIVIERKAALELAEIAQTELEQSRTMEQAERVRFENGASDFFVVNIREETTADAQVRGIIAQLNSQVALVNYNAAITNLSSLGLSTNPN